MKLLVMTRLWSFVSGGRTTDSTRGAAPKRRESAPSRLQEIKELGGALLREEALDDGRALGAVAGASERDHEIATRCRKGRPRMRQEEAGRQRASFDAERLLKRKGRAFAGEKELPDPVRRSEPGMVPDPAGAERFLDPIGGRGHRRRGPRPGQGLLADLAERMAVPALELRGPGRAEERPERLNRGEPGEPGVDRARSVPFPFAGVGGPTPEVVIGLVHRSSARAGFLDNRRERSLE